MAIVENPCIGCRSKFTGEKAPCCKSVDELHLSMDEYRRDFEGKPGVVFLRFTYDRWFGEGIAVHIPDACPDLNEETGLCNIHLHKPAACRDMIPLISLNCTKTPGSFV